MHQARKGVIFFVMFLFMIQLIGAVKPSVETSTEGVGLEIEFPIIEVFPVNSDIELNFHIFNSTNFILDNTSVICYLHMFNVTGNHLVSGNLTYDPTELDFFYIADKSLFKNYGKYSYVVYCHDDNEAAFLGTEFEVSTIGLSQEETGFHTLGMVLGLGIIAFLFLFFAWILDKEHSLLRIILMMFSVYIMLLIPSSLANGFFNTTDNIINILMWFMRLFFTYLFVYLNYVIWLKTKLIDYGMINRRK